MLKGLLVLTLVAYICAETQVSQTCSWGPSFWCSSVKAAKDCGAVHFCIRNTWRQATFTEDIHEDSTCTFCQKMVSDIKDFVTSEQEERVIIAYADKACGEISNKFIADECKGFVNMYIVQIVSMLRQNMDTKAVCHTLNLCASSDMFISPLRFRDQFAVSQQVLTDLAIDKLKTAKVDSKFRALARNTANLGASLKSSEVKPFVGTQADQCNVCKEGVRDLKIVFANTDARDQVEDILKSNICPRFILPSECKKLIDDYAPEIFQAFLNLDPEAACDTIGLCDSKVVSTEIAAPKQVKASVQCVLCEYVMTTIIQALGDKATDQQIIHTVENVCNLLPNSVKSECDTFVEMYGQEIIDLLTHSTDPQSICATIGLCSGSVAKKPLVHVPINKKVGNDQECMMCRLVANYLVSILNENSTTVAVEDALDKVCHMLPSNFGSECVLFVKQNIQNLMQVVMSSLNTETICHDLNMCPASKLQLTPIAY